MLDPRSRSRSPRDDSSILIDLHKQLTDLKSEPDGSFIQKFELLPSLVPIKYHAGNGSFGGYWVTLESKSVFEYETALQWSVYACETGHPQGRFATSPHFLEHCSGFCGGSPLARFHNCR